MRGAPVERLESRGLVCLYSVAETLTGDTETLQRDALDFHRVTREVFRQTDIIPYRYPTMLASLAEVDAYLQKHADAYHDALSVIRGKVQMEVRLRWKADEGEPRSGTEYLQSRAQRAHRAEQAIADLRVAINEEVIDWRQREAARGVRCFVLTGREATGSIQEKIKRVRFDSAVTVALSGPWPPTEFLPNLHG